MKNEKKSSIRFRLTFWYTVVFFLMMALFAAGLYLFSRARMMDLARVRLEDGYRQIAIVLIRSEGDLMDLNHLSSALPFRLTRDGRTRYEKQGWRDLPWPPTKNEGLPIQPDGFSWKTTDGRYFHIHKGIIPEYNYILEYVEEYTEVENNLALLRMFLLLGIPLSLIPAILGGSLLARGALSPVREISRKAEEMGAENLSERLPVQNPGDEIGQLTKSSTIFCFDWSPPLIASGVLRLMHPMSFALR